MQITFYNLYKIYLTVFRCVAAPIPTPIALSNIFLVHSKYNFEELGVSIFKIMENTECKRRKRSSSNSVWHRFTIMNRRLVGLKSAHCSQLEMTHKIKDK